VHLGPDVHKSARCLPVAAAVESVGVDEDAPLPVPAFGWLLCHIEELALGWLRCPGRSWSGPWRAWLTVAQNDDGEGLLAFGRLAQLKLNRLPFGKRRTPRPQDDGALVDENFTAVGALDEAVALFVAVPLHHAAVYCRWGWGSCCGKWGWPTPRPAPLLAFARHNSGDSLGVGVPVTVNDAAALWVIRGEFHPHAVTKEHANVVLAHFAAEVS